MSSFSFEMSDNMKTIMIICVILIDTVFQLAGEYRNGLDILVLVLSLSGLQFSI